MKIALGIEYDGSAYSGWQFQRHSPSVQAVLEAALSRVANHPVSVWCAGRTDAGVHATAQVVHFESDSARSPRAWVLGTNANLPSTVAVRWAHEVPSHFNARFSAMGRSYRYLLANTAARPALWHGRMSWEFRPLNVEAMARAARALLGEHDFSSFRAAGCQAKNPVRTLRKMEITRDGACVAFTLEANAFLHHMVRNIVGALLEVGRGERPEEWIADLLRARDRRLAGMTAPPDGLYLVGVRYPEEFGLPLQDAETALLPSENHLYRGAASMG